MSARYSPLPNTHYLPTVDRCMRNSKTNKQAGAIAGSEELTGEQAQIWLDMLDSLYQISEDVYQKGLSIGVPKEIARCATTVSRYTKMRATTNLRNWLGFLTLRMDPAAQEEIRMFANAVGEFIKVKFPRTWDLFNKERPGEKLVQETVQEGSPKITPVREGKVEG